MENVAKLVVEPEVSSQLEIIKSEIEKVSGSLVLEAVPKLIEARGINAFELGGYLAKIKKEKLWPPDMSFSFWMETQGLKSSRGYRLAQNYITIVNCELPTDILERIEWSKLCLIASLLKPGQSKVAAKHNAKWIELAENSSQLELREAVQKGNGKSGKSDTVQHVLKLHKDQEKTFQAAVDCAKKETEADSDVKAVDAILTGYLAGQTKSVTLKSMMEKCDPADVLEMFAEIWPDIDIQVSF